MYKSLNRNLVKDSFIKYTDKYDSNDEKIKLKIDHTYRVAYLSEKIAKSIGMKSKDIDLAWLIGMLHDIGRFEQIRRYGTFEDSKSVSHAKLGTDILFNDKLIDAFGDICINDKEIIHIAILYHSDYTLPKKLSDREMTFCNIIRGADKIDILKVVG